MIKKFLRKTYLGFLDKAAKPSRLLQGNKNEVHFLSDRWNNAFKEFEPGGIKTYFEKRERPLFVFDPLPVKHNLIFVTSCFPELLSSILEDAENVLEHVFDILGSGPLTLGEKIDWHLDHKTGIGWPKDKYFRSIEMLYGMADMKVPWELSRFHHLMALAKAYSIKPDEKYTKEFMDQINDWIENNPVSFGVNWKCSMECSIRVFNWISAFYCFKDSKSITNRFVLKFLKSLFEHGDHIMKNLENKGRVPTNHYLADLAGLVFLGVMFPEFKESKKWLNFSIKQLVKEMNNQVYEDGCDFEASTCYHGLVLELFFFSTLISVINNDNYYGNNFEEITDIVFGEEYRKKMYKMFDSLCSLIKPNGSLPQIGDNDSGRLLKISDRDNLDRKGLLALGAVFFKESKWKIREFFNTDEDILEVLLIFGEKGRKIWDSLKWNSLKDLRSIKFENAGWYVIRDLESYCLISSGGNGQGGMGGHAHNDKLSFELSIDGCDLIVDPGTYIYSSDPVARNRFRSTEAHNTVRVDGEEINRFKNEKIFSMNEDAALRVNNWEIKENSVFFDGEHSGYKRLAKNVIHNRRIIYDKRYALWMIKDLIKGQGVHLFETFFHFSLINIKQAGVSGVMIEKIKKIKTDFKLNNFNIVDDLILSITDPKGQEYILVPLVQHNMVLEISRGWISPGYGIREKAPAVKYLSETLCPCETVYLICSI